MTRRIELARASSILTAVLGGTRGAQAGKPNPEAANGQHVQLIAQLRDDMNKLVIKPGAGEKQRARFENIEVELAEARAAWRKVGIISPPRMLKMQGAVQ